MGAGGERGDQEMPWPATLTHVWVKVAGRFVLIDDFGPHQAIVSADSAGQQHCMLQPR